MDQEERRKSGVSLKSNTSKTKSTYRQDTTEAEEEDNESINAPEPEEYQEEYHEEEDGEEEEDEETITRENLSRASHNESLTNDSIGHGTGSTRTKSKASIRSANSKSSVKKTGTVGTLTSTRGSTNAAASEVSFLRSFKVDNETFYPMSALKFSQFEGMLFDLLGLPNTAAFKPGPCLSDKVPDVKKLEQLPENSNIFLSDINTISNMIQTNVFNQNQLKDLKNGQRTPKNSGKTADRTSPKEDSSNINGKPQTNQKCSIKTNVLTVIHSSKARPRMAHKLLISKKNTETLDMFMNEICQLFKLEYANVRRLFTLSGVEIESPDDLFEQEAVFIVMGNDKVHMKDFELDANERQMFFANEYMKNVYSSKFSKPEKALKKMEKNKLAKGSVGQIMESQAETASMPAELLKNYHVGNVVGTGHYAVVHQCRDINTGLIFALKIIDLKKCNNKENMIENELDILRKCKHPNIVKLIEEYKTKEHVYLIMEFLKAGDLLEELTAKKKFEEREVALMLSNLTSAIAYLHSEQIVHRDVKLENILIHRANDSSQVLKLADFGLAIRLDGKLNQKCGSPIYVAPEILNGKPYGYEVDVWSLGVITYILLCGFAPYQGDTDDKTFELIKTSELVFQKPYWDEISSDAKDLIAKMLDRNQETRLSADDVLRHKWIVDNTPGLDMNQRTKPESPVRSQMQANKSPTQTTQRSPSRTTLTKSPTRTQTTTTGTNNKSPRKTSLSTNKSVKTNI